LEFIRSNEGEVGLLLQLQKEGVLPLRITHNDTKINNILFDQESDEAVCVIDLDTVMPGLSLYDFGDLVRTATNPAAEDEEDLEKVQMNIGIFEALVEGYLAAVGSVLNKAEIDHMAFSGRLISLELGMRFLTDHLNGDQYFRVQREGQNLDRARTQLRLASQIAEHETAMNSFVQKVARSR
jgi:aminoglycoside phosphotransferase (APT) family kinase protein